MLGDRSLEEKLELIRQTGFDGLDCQVAMLDSPGAALVLRDSEIPMASVYSQVRTPSLLDARAADRAQAVADVVHRARLAAEIGAQNLILVPIFGPPRLAGSGTDAEMVELETVLLIAALKEIAAELRDVPIRVVIEPLNAGETHFLTDPTVAAGLCDRVADARIATMVDTYHCHQEGLDVPLQIDGVGNHLALMHFSDSGRGLPGEGVIDFGAVTAALQRSGYDGWVGWECRRIETREDEAALARSAAYVRALLDDQPLARSSAWARSPEGMN
jgi:sugar phosphate isomerase/epimerase